MIDFFKRSELVRRGLASGKLRRRRTRNGLLRGLEYSWGMKGVLFAAFIAGLAPIVASRAAVCRLVIARGTDLASGKAVLRHANPAGVPASVPSLPKRLSICWAAPSVSRAA